MRDLFLLSILPFLIYASFKRPFIALGLWLWSAAFDINSLVFGVASSVKYNKLFAGITIVSFFISKEKSSFKLESLTIFIILFFIISTLSNMFAIGNVDIAWQRWVLYSKIILFYFFGVVIINKKIHFDFLIWILIITVGGLAATEGVKFIISGGSHRISQIRGLSGDNNFFGVMIVTLIPLTYYIYTQTTDKLLKNGVLVVIFFMVLGVFSTFSRGAFVGLGVTALFILKSSNNKITWLIVLSIITVCMVNFMPESWMSRMNTIENADTDSSFMGRVIAWKIATLIAMDNILGGGFKAVENLSVWRVYALEINKLDFIATPEPPSHFKATHSIYFQVLSNHGFIGLFLFLIILMTAYFKLSRITALATKKKMDNWIIELSKMLQVSVVVFCTSGAAVNVAYFDFIYAIFAMTVALGIMVNEVKNL